MNKTKILNVATIILLIAGLCLLFYPAINNIIFVYNQNQVISEYNEQVIKLDDQLMHKIKDDANVYNENLASTVVEKADDTNEETVSGNLAYSQLLNVSNEQMGYIVIPKISLNQPIYHGTSDEVLERGIGHMENTSLPVGGENTHAVFTGHTGVPGMMLFTDLDKMEIGDKFYLKILDDVLAYEVDSIKVVLPNVTEEFKIVEGEDYVTLVTCTPYGVNTHRLLVRGTRVKYNGEIDDTKIVETSAASSANSSTADEKIVSTKQSKFSKEFVLYYVVIPTLIFVAIILIIAFIKKRKSKKQAK